MKCSDGKNHLRLDASTPDSLSASTVNAHDLRVMPQQIPRRTARTIGVVTDRTASRIAGLIVWKVKGQVR